MRGRGKLLSKCPTVKRVLRCEGENDISFPVNIQSREYSLFSNGEPCFSDAANWTATSHSGREICDGILSLEKRRYLGSTESSFSRDCFRLELCWWSPNTEIKNKYWFVVGSPPQNMYSLIWLWSYSGRQLPGREFKSESLESFGRHLRNRDRQRQRLSVTLWKRQLPKQNLWKWQADWTNTPISLEIEVTFTFPGKDDNFRKRGL